MLCVISLMRCKYKSKHGSSLPGPSTCSKCTQDSSSLIFLPQPSPHPLSSYHTSSSCSGDCGWSPSSQNLLFSTIPWNPYFPLFLLYFLFGANVSSGSFLREVAWAVKTLKPYTPDNVIIFFSHLT